MEEQTALLKDINHHLQAGILALLTEIRQIRQNQAEEPTHIDIAASADFLRTVFESLDFRL